MVEKMFRIKHLATRGSDRLGLLMIVASLVAITLIVVTLTWHQKEARETQIRMQGVSLARMLTGLPYAQLVPAQGQQSLLSTIFQSQNDSNFAYAVIVGAENTPISVASVPGLTVPSAEWPDRTVGWLSDRTLTTSNGENVVEFYAPLYADNTVAAYLRLGYFLPGSGVSLEQLPFLATLALIIFLLTPLFYLLIRHEVRPLREANAQIAKVIESEQFRHVELRATGELGNFIDRFSTFVDFTKQRIENLEREQEELLTSKKLITYSKSRIENVLEAIPEAVLILDQSGRISYANQRIETMFGVSHADVIQSDVSQWCHDVDLLDAISKYSGQPEASYLSETMRLNVRAGKDRQLTAKAYPLFSPTDSTDIYGTLMVFRDITKESIADREQAQFVAHVGHELKTPLNTLALYSEALLNDDADDPKCRIEAANIMHDEVERMAGLIDNLMNITKIETGQISVERNRLRLHDFLEDTFGIAARGEKAQELTFELDLPPELSSIMADKDLLRVALNNLLTNAEKYSRPGGVIKMICQESEQTIRILVRDNGIGISEDDQNRIFDRFYRSEDAEARKRSGHGLGLALARDIVHLHHGTLSVASKPDEGSEFVIEIWKEAGLLKQAI